MEDFYKILEKVRYVFSPSYRTEVKRVREERDKFQEWLKKPGNLEKTTLMTLAEVEKRLGITETVDDLPWYWAHP